MPDRLAGEDEDNDSARKGSLGKFHYGLVRRG